MLNILQYSTYWHWHKHFKTDNTLSVRQEVTLMMISEINQKEKTRRFEVESNCWVSLYYGEYVSECGVRGGWRVCMGRGGGEGEGYSLDDPP